jgi:hypothetical protein
MIPAFFYPDRRVIICLLLHPSRIGVRGSVKVYAFQTGSELYTRSLEEISLLEMEWN